MPRMQPDEVAQQLCLLRAEAGLSQKRLADRVGTTASVICRLENAEYGKHSLAMLRRIATVFGRRVEVRFVALSDGSTGR
jgi:transcriptional regulator with XRE-family HTH domain